MDIVFVYGTLRAQQCNHWLLADARFLAPHVSAPAYTMLDLGPYPGVVSGGSTAIKGELYGLQPGQLAVLDDLEDYPLLYDRQRIPTSHGPAWMYLYRHGESVPARAVVSSGDWLLR